MAKKKIYVTAEIEIDSDRTCGSWCQHRNGHVCGLFRDDNDMPTKLKQFNSRTPNCVRRCRQCREGQWEFEHSECDGWAML